MTKLVLGVAIGYLFGDVIESAFDVVLDRIKAYGQEESKPTSFPDPDAAKPSEETVTT